MKDERKTKQQLIADLADLRAQNAALESSVRALRISEQQPGTIFSTDIGERKRAEVALQHSEQRYKRLTEALSNYIFSVRVKDGRPVETTHSPGCSGVTGFTPEEFARNQYLWISMVHPDDQSAVKEQAQKLLAGQNVLPLEHRIICKYGAERWVRNTFVPHVDETGRLLSYEGLIEDINERKQVELHLAKLYECFLNFSPDPLANINRLTALCGELLQGTCALYNRLERGMLCAWGRWQTPADFIPIDRPDGHICYDVIRKPGASIVVLRNLPETAYAKTDPNVLKYGLRTYVGMAVMSAGVPVGSLCVVYQRDYEPTSHEQELMGLIASAIAVEEKRKQAEEERRRLIAILESTGDLVATATPDRQLTYINRAGKQMLGLRQAESLEGLHIDKCHPRWALEIVANEGIPAAIRDDVWSGETAVLHGDGTEIPVMQTIMAHKLPSGEVEYLSSIMCDISKQKQDAMALQASAKRYRTLYESMMDGSAAVDLAGTIVESNSAFRLMLGYTEEELPTLTYEDITPRKWHELEARIIESQVFMRGYSDLYEKEYIKRDGTVFPIEIRTYLVRDAQGRPSGMWAITRDISQRKQTEKDLIEAKESLENMFATAFDGMIVTDAKGYFIKANRSLERMLGSAEAELKGLHMAELAPEGQHYMDIGIEMMTSLREKGYVENHESAWKRKDGSLCPVEFNIAYLRDKQGITTGAVGSVRDITERKRAEEEHNRLIMAIEQARETVLIMGTDGKVLYANPSVVQTMGYSLDDLIGTKPFPLIGSSDILMKRLFEDAWSKVIAGTAWSGRISEHKKDGTPCELEITVSPVKNSAGDITSFVSIGRDITREVQLEEQLRQSQKMEAIGTLAGGIAHDFNNILTAILGNAEMASCAVGEHNQAGRYLEQIIKATNRASDLVKQILVFSRKGIQERKPVRLHLVLAEVVTLLRASLPSTIEIRQNIQEHADAAIADITQIHQVMLNLGSNAADAMREAGGVLEVSLTPLVLDQNDTASLPGLQPGPCVRLSVRDTGVGIDPAIRDRIFDPFFTTKEVGKGTGMGLAVAHGIVKSHGGAMQVESIPGQGTTFHVFLPTCAEDVAPGGVLLKSSPGGTETILFVDDEEILVDVSRQMLESLGYTVIATTSSSEALEIFAADPNRFDIVITDQTMPHMTGYELARRLLEARPDIPVILCTGYSEIVSPEKARAIGIRQFIMKPVSRPDIAKAVRTVLDTGPPPAT